MPPNLSAAAFIALLAVLLGLAACASPLSTRLMPVRAKMQGGYWKARDGKVMAYTRWPKEENLLGSVPKSGADWSRLASLSPAPAVEKAEPEAGDGEALPAEKGIVIGVHGLSGAASDFWPFGQRAEAAGWKVYAYELRGQGNDPDPASRGDIRSRWQWVDDLASFTLAVRRRHPGVPIFWYGESLGALIILQTATQRPDLVKHLDGVILSCPVVDLRIRLAPLREALIKTAMRLLPWFKVPIEKLGGMKADEIFITAGATVGGNRLTTPHYVPAFSLRLFRQISQLIEASGQAARKWRLPLLVLYTPNDVLTSREQVEAFFAKVPVADKTKLFHPDCYHLLLHDVDREKVLKETMAWLEARLPREELRCKY